MRLKLYEYAYCCRRNDNRELGAQPSRPLAQDSCIRSRIRFRTERILGVLFKRFLFFFFSFHRPSIRVFANQFDELIIEMAKKKNKYHIYVVRRICRIQNT